MKHYFVCFALAALLATSGCAWYTITPISKSEVTNWGSSNKEGYIISQPELYFAATITETTSTNKEVKQDISVTPLYLPNPYKAYRVTTHNILGKADFAFAFENGWKLTQLSDKSDNTTIANTLAGELSTILKAAGPAIASGPTPKKRVFLYQPYYAEDGSIQKFLDRGEITLGSETELPNK